MNNGINVLLIEDNPLDACLLQEILSEDTEEKWNIIQANSLKDGIKIFNAHTFHVVLLDLILPDSRGLETFYAVQKRMSGIPIIVLSGLDDHSLAAKTVQEGAQDYLVKGLWGEPGPSVAKRLSAVIRHAITRHKALNALKNDRRLEHRLAYYDTLTDLPNRHLFYDRLHLAMTQAKRSNQQLALLFLDLDGFKNINDSYGHSTGDGLLKAFSTRLKECVREGDTLARLSGDEFVMLLANVADLDAIQKIAEKILHSCSRPFQIENQEIGLTTSIGISLFPINGTNSHDLIRNADIAMYRSKSMGKNTYQFFELESEVNSLESVTSRHT